jgi:hypothetical protein
MKRYCKGDKLANVNKGPFKILEREGNAYRLELPPGISIGPVFLPDKLRKATEDPLPD